jgi:hypothetical protein
VAGGWWLVAGGWWLVAGGWWLVAGGWWDGAPAQSGVACPMNLNRKYAPIDTNKNRH